MYARTWEKVSMSKIWNKSRSTVPPMPCRYFLRIVLDFSQNFPWTLQVIRAGNINRRVGSTSMNSESSRSHSVLTVYIQSRENRSGIVTVKSSKLNIIDLAGSERQKSTDTTGMRLKEAGNINKSLSCLGNVIRALVDVANGHSRHVHYRDSKLTFLLKVRNFTENSRSYSWKNLWDFCENSWGLIWIGLFGRKQ